MVRVKPDDTGRYRIDELHMFSTGEPVTAERLRALRVSAIESILNLPEERAALEARLDEKRRGKMFETFVDSFRREFDDRHTRTTTPVAQTATFTWESTASKLSPPVRRGYPDEFYVSVADVYRDALRHGGRPIAAVVAETGVSRSKAARWVKEARRRGLLAPAPAPGKAGA